jgi:hypothetical protein
MTKEAKLQGLETQIGEEIILITDQIQDMSSNYTAEHWFGKLAESAESNSLITYGRTIYCICRSNTEGCVD